MMKKTIILAMMIQFAGAIAFAKAPIVPIISGDWWQIAGNPDLGDYTSDKQEPVDFGIWQAADGTWQLWSCIRNTKAPGHTRVFHGWEGKNLTDKSWKPLGIVMESDPALGEAPGGLQAPHVIFADGRYLMAFGDWTNICFAESKDGKKFTRIVQPGGKTGLFSEGAYANTRDPMMINIGGLWHIYYTAIAGTRGYSYCRTSADLKNWSPSFVISYGGSVGTGPWWNECPFVVEPAPGEFVYFRNQFYGEGARNWVYYSTNPYNFGIDNDENLVADFPIAAPEIIKHDGKYFIAALNPKLDGIRMTELRWGRRSEAGDPVFDFDNTDTRAKWKMTEGDFEQIFWSQTHAPFEASFKHVIGTCETKAGPYNDVLTGVIESPPFAIDSDQYVLYVGGGGDMEKVYVAIIDAATGEELARFTGSNRNIVEPRKFKSAAFIGRNAIVRVVDKHIDGWGHINFGGIFKKGEVKPID